MLRQLYGYDIICLLYMWKICPDVEEKSELLRNVILRLYTVQYLYIYIYINSIWSYDDL